MPSAAGPSSSSTIRDGTRMPTRQSHPKQPACHASVFHNRLIYMRKKSELRRVRKPVRAAGQILTGPARQFMPPGRPPAAEKTGALTLRTGMGPACLEAGRVRPCFSRAARGRRHAAGSRTLPGARRSTVHRWLGFGVDAARAARRDSPGTPRDAPGRLGTPRDASGRARWAHRAGSARKSGRKSGGDSRLAGVAPAAEGGRSRRHGSRVRSRRPGIPRAARRHPTPARQRSPRRGRSGARPRSAG